MAFLAKLFTGRVPLWITFWLIGIPFAVVWDLSGGCMLAGCGAQSFGPRVNLIIEGLSAAFFTLSSVGVGVASVAIWRSASTHRRATWWERLLEFSAKVYAALTGAITFLVLSAILYALLHYFVSGLVS